VLHVSAGALRDLGSSLAEEFDLSRVSVVTGNTRSREIGEALASELRTGGSRVDLHAGSAGTLNAGARLLEQLDEAPVSLVVAVGGGRPIDIAKLASTRAGVDLVAVPTVLSHDGMCSPVASLIGADGARRSIGVSMPAGVVIDTDVVGQAPLRYVRAGIGDLISNITAVGDWMTAAATTGETVDHLAASIALLSAQSAFDVSWPPTPEDLAIIGRGLVMSGMAMEMAGSSRPCSGAEHLISHSLDATAAGGQTLHGDQVALGVMLTARMQAAPELGRIAALFEKVGFPASLEGWGLDRDTLVRAVQGAPSTRPGRRTVLDDADLSPTALEKLIDSVFAGGPT
jgi:glycerol-1-phosphate dehydrogenase [NAD(P)+]